MEEQCTRSLQGMRDEVVGVGVGRERICLVGWLAGQISVCLSVWRGGQKDQKSTKQSTGPK